MVLQGWYMAVYISDKYDRLGDEKRGIYRDDDGRANIDDYERD